jgi:hypothetical protein
MSTASLASLKSGKADDDGKKKEKPVKIKLTKEQKLFVEGLVKVESRALACREFISLWMNFFRFFADMDPERQILPKDEKAFFQLMTSIARRQFLFTEQMADKFERGADIINVLGMAVSLANIQAMNENTRAKLDLDWHSLFLDMNKALGRLLREMAGNKTLTEAMADLEVRAAAAHQAAATAKEAAATQAAAKDAAAAAKAK